MDSSSNARRPNIFDNLSDNADRLIEACLNLFLAHELLGFPHPVMMFREIMARFNKVSLGRALDDPMVPDEIKEKIRPLLEISSGELTPEQADELMSLLDQHLGEPQPPAPPSANDDQGGAYL